ncbi:right-handed parallel beta-helix repeat-containing protein [Maribellus maritimus]|uniref:right-handed parallel beta-helix repeat-containing protein n=1 Tax=Maribellus maritimus TaxID=2870838 RepID=UPI001EEC812C|nr:right-handed parallel beta-helix repeat-containing protein [Maribellus maritimus]MCG6187590.1 right-handed parallel beta-helix repeat-containing protein [Maribellus maritimus]
MKPDKLICFLIGLMILISCRKDDLKSDDNDPVFTAENLITDPIFQRQITHFITSTDENTQEVIFPGGAVEELQVLINNMRSSHSESVIIVHIRGKITVGDTPLVLGDKTCLSFESCGSMVAENTSNCPALIHIKDAEYVSIGAVNNTAIAELDGGGIAERGISVTNSGKVNIDNVNISGYKNYGIFYQGRGNDQLNDAGSITRCILSGTGENGILVKSSARFVLIDNIVANHSSFGVNLISQSATVAGNFSLNNQTGIFVNVTAGIDGPGGVVARNVMKDNNIGLELGSNTKKILVTENEFSQNTKGMIIGGQENQIFNNDITGGEQFEINGSGNVVAGHRKVLGSEIAGGANMSYFNPPTKDNPHDDPMIVNGMGRYDITISQGDGEPDVDLAEVQVAVNEARQTHSGDVLVVWLNGSFVAKGDHTGLDVPSNTCVILDGTIYPEGSGMDANSDESHNVKEPTTGGTQLVLMKSGGYASFSGGILDSKDLSAYGIYAPGNNVAIIDGVTVKNAEYNNIGVLYHSGATTPAFIRDCHFDGNGETNRAIWMHLCDNIHVINCASLNHYADFVDIDAGANYNSVLFSQCENEKRTGIFIEEKASNNFLLGNTMTGSGGNAISLYSSIGGQCKNNILVCNNCTGPNGMNIRYAANTFAFNNIMNTGQFGVYINVNDNYSSQNTSLEQNYNLPKVPENPWFSIPYYSYSESGNDCGL